MSRRLLTALALALVAVAPLAAAESGQVSAEAAVYRGGARQHGEALAFYLMSQVAVDPGNEVVPPAPVPDGAPPLLGIDIQAAHLEALVVERTYLHLGSGAVIQPDPRAPPQQPERIVLEHAHGKLTAQQSLFQVHLVPPGLGQTVPYQATTQSGRFDAQDSVYMSSGQFRRVLTQEDADARNADSPEFWSVRLEEPLVVHEDQAGDLAATFRGDLVLELEGGTLAVRDNEGEHVLESGVWSESPAPGLAVLDPAATVQREALVRLFLVDAVVRLTVQGGNPALYVAAPSIESEQDGDTTLLGATGSVQSGQATRQLDGERFDLPAGHTLLLRSGDERMDAGFAPSAVPGDAGGGTTFADQGPATMVAVTAILALLAAIGLGVLRRATSPPDLRAVEAAIEAQRFSRAARMAKRILRARPGLEDAVLGRAIALSRAGRAGAAISEIHAQLELRGPTDGSLHYVLGLALLDVGRLDDARVALAEAVRLTPALHEDVASRLGNPQASSSPGPTSLREVHGYA